MNATIIDYQTGKVLAHHVEVDWQLLDRIADRPQGCVKAEHILSDYQISEIAGEHDHFTAATLIRCQTEPS